MSSSNPSVPSQSTQLNRRAAIARAVQGTVVASLAAPIMAQAASHSTSPVAQEFVPENDYPFFDGDLPEAYQTPNP